MHSVCGWIATSGQGSLDDLVTRQVGLQFVLAPLFLLAVVFSFRWQRQVGLKPAEPGSGSTSDILNAREAIKKYGVS
jgi:hypothetical protein